MSFAIRYTSEARKDINDAFDYYENEQVGLGERFLTALAGQESFIAKYPMAAQEVGKGRRRSVVEPFKYNVIYRLDVPAESVTVIAVMHGSRDPKRWWKR